MDPGKQKELLERIDKERRFADCLRTCLQYSLRARSVEILQLNITRRCNLACRHCHVEGFPDRVEEMDREVMEACLQAASFPTVTTLDITGGSPEMHPGLEWFLRKAAELHKRLLVRTNAVILLEEPYRRFFDVYAEAGVEVVVSLPNLHREKTDRMRGEGVFERLIAALGTLNARGYGMPGSGLVLHLVHNPAGAFLPGPQRAIEQEYRTTLRSDYGIEFNNLFCLTNCPAGRFLDFLERSGNLEDYFDLLKRAFNPEAVNDLMCRTTVSVGFDGRLFDCDFNQILGLPVRAGAHAHIKDLDFEKLASREIAVGSHCYCCTAGAGSSCQGTLSP